MLSRILIVVNIRDFFSWFSLVNRKNLLKAMLFHQTNTLLFQ